MMKLNHIIVFPALSFDSLLLLQPSLAFTSLYIYLSHPLLCIFMGTGELFISLIESNKVTFTSLLKCMPLMVKHVNTTVASETHQPVYAMHKVSNKISVQGHPPLVPSTYLSHSSLARQTPAVPLCLSINLPVC